MQKGRAIEEFDEIYEDVSIIFLKGQQNFFERSKRRDPSKTTPRATCKMPLPLQPCQKII